MQDFFLDIGAFTSKIFIVILLMGILFALVGGVIAEQKKDKKKKKLVVEDISDTFQNYSLKVKSITQNEKTVKKEIKTLNKEKKKKKKTGDDPKKPCVYVLDFKGDIEASQVHLLRDEISIILKTADPKKDEVIIKLNNRGGIVHNHGLGASQLQRLRDKGFSLTICVDEVAGSGGYLMACVAHKILAAPFAVIGSIGVLAQIPNFHRFLRKQDVDYEEHHAGEFKRTLTMFGESTEEKRKKLKEQLEEIHTHFKNYILKFRPKVDLAKVATGEHWLGIRAKELGLIDDIMVSDEYIHALLPDKKVFQISLKEEELVGIQKLFSKKVAEFSNSSFLLLLKKLLKK